MKLTSLELKILMVLKGEDQLTPTLIAKKQYLNVRSVRDALSNHLLPDEVVERTQFGIYRITIKGLKLLSKTMELSQKLQESRCD